MPARARYVRFGTEEVQIGRAPGHDIDDEHIAYHRNLCAIAPSGGDGDRPVEQRRVDGPDA
ncbi:hypothetical protein ACFXGA_05670 [Actinosynnema sp. NPDC059335]|uniref:hypothetical protein n=1 Tax=Actinosynnema sp. NPDC059335 TaxID=3346804 RepID=UPI0036706B40